jgi:hypothetical protein
LYWTGIGSYTFQVSGYKFAETVETENLKLLARSPPLLGVVHAQVTCAGIIIVIAPPDFEDDLVAFGEFGEIDGVFRVAGGLAVDLHDDVAGLQAGLR